MGNSLMMRMAAAGIAASISLAPAAAQPVRTVDPSAAMQSDIAPVQPVEPGFSGSAETRTTVDPGASTVLPGAASPVPDDSHPVTAPAATTSAANGATYQQSDVMDAAEGVFGRGAEGLAKIVEKVLKDQGEPSAYIAGREAGAAFAIGLRYGSGVMHHKVEGDRPVYWTGPSLGFDIGGNGAKSFILVYNLYDSQELFTRFPAAEGAAYLIGGFTASYLRRGNIVLIPIRLGVGWRLGANVGYLNFTEKSRWLPF